jgi:hypothetical protein
MASLFANKLHKSYVLRDKADKRTEILFNKFIVGANKNAEDDKRINAEFETKNKAFNAEEEMKIQQKKTLA